MNKRAIRDNLNLKKAILLSWLNIPLYILYRFKGSLIEVVIAERYGVPFLHP